MINLSVRSLPYTGRGRTPAHSACRSTWLPGAAALLLSGLVVMGMVATLALGETTSFALDSLGMDPALLHTSGTSTAATHLPSSNSTSCGLLTSQSIPRAVYQNVTTMFSEVCQSPQFVSLIIAWGPGNFTMGYATVNGSLTAVAFTVNWASGCDQSYFGQGAVECTYTEYWLGTISNDSITGPYIEEHPATSSGGPQRGASSPLTELSALLILAIAGAGVTVSSALLVANARRRRAALREAVLVAPETTPTGGAVPLVGEVLSSQDNPDHPMRVDTERSTDTLEDLF